MLEYNWKILEYLLEYVGILTLWLCQNSYGKLPFTAYIPMKNGDFHSFVSLPEGKMNSDIFSRALGRPRINWHQSFHHLNLNYGMMYCLLIGDHSGAYTVIYHLC